MEVSEIRKISLVERDAILAALAALNWNRTHAARALGISIRTLRNKLVEYRQQGVEVPDSPWQGQGRPAALKEERPCANRSNPCPAKVDEVPNDG